MLKHLGVAAVATLMTVGGVDAEPRATQATPQNSEEMSAAELNAMGDLARAHQRNDVAAYWYNLSAKAGEQGSLASARSMHELGFLYEHGLGVPQDYVLAHKWHNLAASYGFGVSRLSRQDLENNMAPEQIAEAQRLARDWIAERR